MKNKIYTFDSLFQEFSLFVNSYPIEESLFYKFCQNANQKEFLTHQIPFFNAVQSFPQMLSFLASKIKTTQNRLLVIENLYEEHGKSNSNYFHTTTYMQYLFSLGFNQSDKISEHPATSYWIYNMLEGENSKHNSYQYAISLCAIEYIYTKVSNIIIKSIERFELQNIQKHYHTHEVLDIEHSKELFEVAKNEMQYFSFLLNKNNYSNIINLFKKSINDFILMLNQMTFFTQNELNFINSQQISFYYSRENSSPELYALDLIYKNENTEYQPNVLIIASGGEHCINIKKQFPTSNLFIFDINKNQLLLTEKFFNGNKKFIFNEGKFEIIFDYLFKKISPFYHSHNFLNKFSQDFYFNEIKYFFYNNSFLYDIVHNKNHGIQNLKYIINELFSNKNLEFIFTEEATKYSKKEFSEHFYNIIINNLIQLYKYINENNIASFEDLLNNKNIYNILNMLHVKNIILENYNNLKNINKENIFFIHNDIINTFQTLNNLHSDNQKIYFDLISISNIGDWMPQEEYLKTIDIIYDNLKKDGFIVSRKLLGDYNLKTILQTKFLNSFDLIDETNFYSETIISKKLV